MGFYVRYLRPGHIGEVSVIGFVLLMAAIWLGGQAVFEHAAGVGPVFRLQTPRR